MLMVIYAITFFSICFYLIFLSVKKGSFVYLLFLPIVLILNMMIAPIIRNDTRPIRLTKAEIIGQYKIDESLYLSKNAMWQKEHFWFEITDKDELILHEILDDGSAVTLNGKLEWFIGPPDIWAVNMQESHHLFTSNPILYRGPKKFYYVLNSSKFGNMFFRKVKDNNKNLRETKQETNAKGILKVNNQISFIVDKIQDKPPMDMISFVLEVTNINGQQVPNLKVENIQKFAKLYIDDTIETNPSDFGGLERIRKKKYIEISEIDTYGWSQSIENNLAYGKTKFKVQWEYFGTKSNILYVDIKNKLVQNTPIP